MLLFTARPQVRAAYQDLFAQRLARKEYRALAPLDDALRTPATVRNRIEKTAGDLRALVVDGEREAAAGLHVIPLVRGRVAALLQLGAGFQQPVTLRQPRLQLRRRLQIGMPGGGGDFRLCLRCRNAAPHQHGQHRLRRLAGKQLLGHQLAQAVVQRRPARAARHGTDSQSAQRVVGAETLAGIKHGRRFTTAL